MMPRPRSALRCWLARRAIVGAKKLPMIGDAFGRTIRTFRRASSGADELEVGADGTRIGRDSGPPAVH